MPASLQINQSQHNERVPVTLFELTGEMDGSNYDQFQRAAQQAIEAGTRYILLDFSRLQYISSAGLRALYVIAKALAAKGRSSGAGDQSAGTFKSPFLKLLNPTATVHAALDVMGFNMSMEIHADLQAALASFQ